MRNEKIANTKSNDAVKVIIGGIFLIFGLATLSMYVGYAFLFVSIIAFTYGTGIEIDHNKQKIRTYTRYLWVIKGKWFDLANYRNISIRRIRKGMKQYGGRSNASTSTFYTYYDIFLMPGNYHKKILLFSSQDENISRKQAEEWSKKLDKPFIF